MEKSAKRRKYLYALSSGDVQKNKYKKTIGLQACALNLAPRGVDLVVCTYCWCTLHAR
jgi:hypothetical protein